MASALVEKKISKFHKAETRTTWRGPYAEHSAFDKCHQLAKPKWIHLLPPNQGGARTVEAEEFYEELRKDLH